MVLYVVAFVKGNAGKMLDLAKIWQSDLADWLKNNYSELT
jgi:hypothetical protein